MAAAAAASVRYFVFLTDSFNLYPFQKKPPMLLSPVLFFVSNRIHRIGHHDRCSIPCTTQDGQAAGLSYTSRLPRVMDSHPFFRIIHGKSRIECAVLAAHHVSKIFLFHLFLLAAGGKRAPNCLHLGVWSPHGHACLRPRLQTAVLLPLYCIQTIKEMPAALIAAGISFLFPRFFMSFG